MGKDGVAIPMLGNAEVNLNFGFTHKQTLPNGSNQCIGSYEDKQSKSIIWFNYNSNNQHGIYRYWYETGRVDEVLVYPLLDFSPNRKIHDVAVIDGKYLIFTDVLATDYALGGTPLPTNVGSQPRCVDMELSTLIGGTIAANTGIGYKALEYEIFLHYNTATVAVLPNDILIQAKITNFAGTIDLVAWTTIATITQQDDASFATTKEEIYNQISLAMEALVGGTVGVDKRKFASITLSAANGGRRLLLQVLENNAESTKVTAYARPVNHYYFPYENEQFDLARPMPLDHIDAVAGKSEAFTSDSCFGKYFQFCYRYHFYDNGRSAWSPFSDVPTNMEINVDVGEQAVFAVRDYSAIYLRFDDEKLVAPWIGFIKMVEIGYRESNDLPIVSIGKFNHWDINDSIYINAINQTKQRAWQKIFTGEELTTAIPSDEVGSTGDTQVLKLYDWIPDRVNGLCAVADETGTARLLVGGEAMGQINPVVKATLEVKQSPLVTDTFPIAEGANDYIQTNRKYLKKGGRYQYQITYFDGKGKTPGAIPLGEVKVPYEGGVNKFHYVRITFDTPPPSWAVRWRITRTKNLNQSIYKQYPCWHMSKVRFVDKVFWGWGMGALLPIEEATHLRFQIGTVEVEDQDNNIFTQLFDDATNDSQTVWVPESGHRLQVVAFMKPNSVAITGSWVADTPNAQGFFGEMADNPFAESLDSGGFNFRVVGYQKEVTDKPEESGGDGLETSSEQYIRYYALVEKEGAYPLMEAAALTALVDADLDAWTSIIELYKAGQEPAEITYETVAKDEVHVTGNEYTHRASGDPQRIDVLGGDTYHISPLHYRLDWPWGIGGGTIPVNDVQPTTEYIEDHKYQNWHFEVRTQYSYNTKLLQDIGRGLSVEPFTEEEYNYQRFRISDAYTPSTKINGLCSFRGLNYKDINKNFGPIMAMRTLQDNVDIICWNKIQPVYVGKGRVLQLDGQEQVGRSNELLALAGPVREDWGTQNPESIATDGKSIWAVDRRMGLVWRRAQDGMTPISHIKNLNYFKNKLLASESSYTADLFIFGGYNPRLNMYFFTIGAHTLYADQRDPVQVAGKTYGFCESDNNWKDEFEFIPEMYGMGGPNMYTWKSGELWKHDQTETNYPVVAAVTPCNFYGEQYAPQITFVVNKFPGSTKVWQCIRIQSKDLWTAPVLRIPENHPYLDGMLSRLKEANIRNEEGMFVADFLRDMNDPNFADIVDPTTRAFRSLLLGRPLRGEIIVVTLEGELDNDLVRVDTEFFASMKTN
jgi:hypothetical protein